MEKYIKNKTIYIKNNKHIQSNLNLLKNVLKSKRKTITKGTNITKRYYPKYIQFKSSIRTYSNSK